MKVNQREKREYHEKAVKCVEYVALELDATHKNYYYWIKIMKISADL